MRTRHALVAAHSSMKLSPLAHRSMTFAPGFASFMIAARAPASGDCTVSNLLLENWLGLRCTLMGASHVLFVMSAAALYFVTTSDCTTQGKLRQLKTVHHNAVLADGSPINAASVQYASITHMICPHAS